MWVALVISLALITLFFHLFITNSPTSVYTHRADVLSTMVWLMRSIVKQGFSSIPNISGCRPFLICWWLATLVLSTSYVSNLIAFITVPGQPNKIRTLKELVESHHPLYIADYGSFIPSYMATSNDPLYLKMSQKLNYLLEYSDIIDQVYQSEAAFLEGTNYIEFLNIPFEYYYVREVICPVHVAWAFQKGTPWVYVFNRYLTRIKESGLSDKWRQDVVKNFRLSRGKSPWTKKSKDTSQRALSLTDLLSSFFILVPGIIAALFTFIIERVVAHNTVSK
ncbi:glutamate receptor 2-like [Homarus americanus]|uniref:glutamate receptor 2-like n=1 Tax=Homarus americanus TaxID=6706 RepID=UPI001C440C02|nr:glutamate receptor 2-like [Homarus americanus]